MNLRTPPPCRFGAAEVEAAADAWGFNCGPAALCAVLGLTPAELRSHLLDFEQRGYTNPSLMADILSRLGIPFRRVFECLGAREATPDAVRYPTFGLVRVQWGGPWTYPGVPVAARYRHTHWVAVAGHDEAHRLAFDINAFGIDGYQGGWFFWRAWCEVLTPWILESHPRADGRWWPTHCWEVNDRG